MITCKERARLIAVCERVLTEPSPYQNSEQWYAYVNRTLVSLQKKSCQDKNKPCKDKCKDK